MTRCLEMGIAAAAVVAMAACGGALGSRVDRDEYVAANIRLFRELPAYPGTRLQEEVSTAYRSDEGGPVAGYSTRFVLDLPPGADAAEVASFYADELPRRRWRLAERLDGPVLNFRRAAASVSVNLESWRAGALEIAVDHGGEEAPAAAAPPPQPQPQNVGSPAWEVPEPRVPPPSGEVHRLRVRVEAGQQTHELAEWVAPRSGHCRSEGERVEISTDRLRATIAPAGWGAVAGVVVRAGSPRFVHGLGGERCAGLVALRAEGGGGEARWRGGRVSATIEATITEGEAARRGLFSIEGEPLRGYDVERAPTEPPAAPIAVYWLGPSHGRLVALQAIEHLDRYRGEERTRVHIVFYGRPPMRAGAPQIQVSSMPLGDALARRTLDELERHVRVHGWPRYDVELASGEPARVFPNLGEGRRVVSFSVVTEETLVGVSPARGLSLPEVRELAMRIRPLPASRP